MTSIIANGITAKVEIQPITFLSIGVLEGLATMALPYLIPLFILLTPPLLVWSMSRPCQIGPFQFNSMDYTVFMGPVRLGRAGAIFLSALLILSYIFAGSFALIAQRATDPYTQMDGRMDNAMSRLDKVESQFDKVDNHFERVEAKMEMRFEMIINRIGNLEREQESMSNLQKALFALLAPLTLQPLAQIRDYFRRKKESEWEGDEPTP